MMPSHPDDGDALQLQPDPDKLFRYHRQQLSAMLDGELSPDQARFMLRRLDHDTELADCWARWQVCGDMLRGRHHALLPADFAAGVARAVADGARLPDDAAATAGTVAGGRRAGILRWGGGAALVASVAMVALLVGRQAQVPLGPESEREQVAVAGSAAGGPSLPSGPVPSERSPVLAQAAAGGQPTDGQSAGALDSGALALAGASALAIAEVPRRDERRSRGQSQRAAVTRVQRRDEPTRVAATAVGAGPAAASAVTSAPERVATELPRLAMEDTAGAPRPWPRAGFGATSPFAASYGAADAALSFHPFEPRIGDASPRPRLGVSIAAPAWGTPATAIGTRRFEAPANAPVDPSPHIE